MADEVLTEIRDRVMLITLNRPEAMNSVNLAVATQLAAALDELDENADVSVGVLTGNGRGFSSGMDLKAFVSGGMPQVPGRGFAGITERSANKPLVAAVEGFALAGGLEIALSCDLLVASEGTKLGIPEVRVGLFAGAGALARLPRRLPYGMAMQMALTAEPITAEQAHQYGLVQVLTEKGQALEAALDLANRVAQNAPLALQASKLLIRELQGSTEAEFWEMQKPHIEKVFLSEDGMEGAIAFAEKRPAVWKGR